MEISSQSGSGGSKAVKAIEAVGAVEMEEAWYKSHVSIFAVRHQEEKTIRLLKQLRLGGCALWRL